MKLELNITLDFDEKNKKSKLSIKGTNSEKSKMCYMKCEDFNASHTLYNSIINFISDFEDSEHVEAGLCDAQREDN